MITVTLKKCEEKKKTPKTKPSVKRSARLITSPLFVGQEIVI